MKKEHQIFEYLIRLGDSQLVLGQRLSEWCGHGPILEEDIALTNISLDLLGSARILLTAAGNSEGKGRTEDDLAFLRDAMEFRNVLLVEQPNGDFGNTVVRQFLYDAYSFFLFDALKGSKEAIISGAAEKILKETTYHLRHSREWFIRLGDGTHESHERVQRAVDNLWRFTADLFDADETDDLLLKEGIAADGKRISAHWNETVAGVFHEAGLQIPSGRIWMARGSRQGIHTEHLGHLLAEMQFLPRAYPGTNW